MGAQNPKKKTKPPQWKNSHFPIAASIFAYRARLIITRVWVGAHLRVRRVLNLACVHVCNK